MSSSQVAEINQLKANIAELERLGRENHKQQQKEINRRLTGIEKWLPRLYKKLDKKERNSQQAKKFKNIDEKLENIEKSRDDAINQLKTKVEELEKLDKENDAKQEKKIELKLSQLEKWFETQKSKILVEQTSKNHADKINSFESKILELEKQIETLEKRPPSAEILDTHQFEVHAGAIVDSIRIHGRKYGINGGSKNVITVNKGERIKNASFRLAPFRNQACMCQLVFTTDKGQTFGPYGYANGNQHYNVEFKGDWTKQIKMASMNPTGFEGKKLYYKLL